MKNMLTNNELKKRILIINVALAFATCSAIIQLNPIKNKVPGLIAGIIAIILTFCAIILFRNQKINYIAKLTKTELVDLLGFQVVMYFSTIYLFFLVVYILSGTF